eukprot:gnl/MRDRNA2_/MRDRNA2_65325_c0_seq1.p1 gnl/MRDRNA2_/MRDRNA2_65325_c0~~gnl/MRDRNA2_/MRDRNA2_65325_c0_seq1.p1  ORF type:complete len:616 (-),score=127.23 gnl/MRDRNA2_/MRDRNA2_65325_c0_seq1:101-1948(-)
MGRLRKKGLPDASNHRFSKSSQSSKTWRYCALTLLACLCGFALWVNTKVLERHMQSAADMDIPTVVTFAPKELLGTKGKTNHKIDVVNSATTHEEPAHSSKRKKSHSEESKAPLPPPSAPKKALRNSVSVEKKKEEGEDQEDHKKKEEEEEDQEDRKPQSDGLRPTWADQASPVEETGNLADCGPKGIKGDPGDVAKQQRGCASKRSLLNQYLAVYGQLCAWDLGIGKSLMHAEAEQREVILEMYNPLVQANPIAELTKAERPALPPPDCGNHLYKNIFSGKPLAKPRVLVDVTAGMGGSGELDLLEMRLFELNASLGQTHGGVPSMPDVYVVAESKYNYRGDLKALHFEAQRDRFKRFVNQIEHIVLDNCPGYEKAVKAQRRIKADKRGKNVWGVQDSQKGCVLKTLVKRRTDIPDDALLIFSDLDEIPRAETVQLLRSCELRKGAKQPFTLMHHPMPFNLRVGCKHVPDKDLWPHGAVTSMGYLRRHNANLFLWYNHNDMVARGGTHITYAGSRAQVDYKLLCHGESGQVLPLIVGGDSPDNLPGGVCAVDASALKQMEKQLADNPLSVCRRWEHKSKMLPEAVASSKLAECNIPWVLINNPDRYPHFWGKIV